MILVALGTQDISFARLLEAVQKQIDNGVIQEKVIVQAGCTKFRSNDMEIFDFISTEKFNHLIKEARLIICHAGVGIILDALRNKKKVIAAARSDKYKEHVNDHQMQILGEFEKKGYILALRDFYSLDILLKDIDNFVPTSFVPGGDTLRNIIMEFIDNL